MHDALIRTIPSKCLDPIIGNYRVVKAPKWKKNVVKSKTEVNNNK